MELTQDKKVQFAELTSQLRICVEQIQNIKRQIQLGNNQLKKSEITEQEVAKLSPEKRVASGVGRMFVFQPRSILENRFDEYKGRIQNELKEYEASLEELEQKYQSLVKQTNDLLGGRME